MKTPAIILAYVFPLLGIPLGYYGKSAFSQPAGSGIEIGKKGKGSPKSATSSELQDVVPRLVTDESLESLVAQGDGVSYASLSLWLLDADAAEIAAFWEHYRATNPGGDLRRLLFINWTRLDPSAAITATKGTDDEKLVWWAWAAHDPETAMSAAPTEEWRIRVAKGAGEFHPEWVRENFENIPEEARSSAIEGIRTWKEDGDHAATLDFLLEHGNGHTGSIFSTFARKDPWGAYDWLVKNDRLGIPQWGNQEVDSLIRQMKELHPDDLERMAAMTPSGQVRWKMEDALFESLLETDPERALENARSGDAPLVNMKRLASIGDKLLDTDPEKAFDLAAEILMISKGGLSPNVMIDYEGGGIHYGSSDSHAEDFMARVLAKDPYRTLDMAAGALTDSSSRVFDNLSRTVAEKDLDGYAAWVNRQTDPKSIERGTGVVVSGLAQRGNFHEASEWAMNGYKPEGSMPNGLFSLVHQWSQRDVEGAREWLESSPVSEQHKANMKSIMDHFSK